MEKLILENQTVENDSDIKKREEQEEQRRKARRIHEEETARAEAEGRKIKYNEAYEEGKAGLNEHDPLPYDKAYFEAVKGLKPDEDPNYVPMAEKAFSFDFQIDPRYSFEQREKIEKYTEILAKEMEEISRLGEASGLSVKIVLEEKKKEIEEIAEIAGKKKLFSSKNKKVIDNLDYVGDPKENAKKIIEMINSQK